MATAAPPTSERGRVLTGWTPLPGWGGGLDDREYVPELRWPQSVAVYDRMRADSQVAALIAGWTLPVRRYRWELDRNGADEAMTARLAGELGLPVRGEAAASIPRRGDRFSFHEHLFNALTAVVYGHAFFEQVGRIQDGLWALRKLGPRPQWSIDEINVARDGGLEGITQTVGAERVHIPVSRLVAYVWDREPGQWQGRSALRPLYRDWYLKDRLLRINAIGHERAARGVPYVEPPPGATDAQLEALQEMAEAIASGESTAAVGVAGAKLHLVGMQGASSDVIASVRYHDEAMARAFLLMVMQLGTTASGSRALGESHLDIASDAQLALADWFVDVFTAHVIEDWWAWNVPGDGPAPVLAYDPGAPELALSDFVALVEAGAIIVDDEVEDWLRQRTGMPERGAGTSRVAVGPRPSGETPPPEPPPEPAPESAPATPVAAAAAAGRGPWRREPTAVELRTRTDFAAIDAAHQATSTAIAAVILQERARWTEELAARIEARGDMTAAAVAALPPPVPGDDAVRQVAAFLDLERRRTRAQTAAEIEAQTGTPIPEPVSAATSPTSGLADLAFNAAASHWHAAMATRAVGVEALPPEQAAAAIRETGADLSAAQVETVAGGVTSNTQAQGRSEAHTAAADAGLEGEWYASEILDRNTCGPCAQWDGHVFASREEAEAQYPGLGGNKDCEGWNRCRGLVIVDYLAHTGPVPDFSEYDGDTPGPEPVVVEFDETTLPNGVTLEFSEGQKARVQAGLDALREAMPGLDPADLRRYRVSPLDAGTDPGVGGRFYPRGQAGDGTPSIAVRPGDDMETLTVHEFAHGLDWAEGERLGRSWATDITRRDEMHAFLDAAINGSTLARARELYNAEDYARYHLDKKEIFARAIQQRTYEVTGRAEVRPFAGTDDYPMQWNAEDWAVIRPLLDNVLRGFGWID